jgi:hypothetical protein
MAFFIHDLQADVAAAAAIAQVNSLRRDRGVEERS